MNEPNLPKVPEHLETLLKELKHYPVLVLRPGKRNKVNIVQILQKLPTEIIKLILPNLDKQTGEDVVLHHNITKNNSNQ